MVSYVKQEGYVGKLRDNKLYFTWRMMNVRCYDSKHKAYHRYGGRGVTVCDDWCWSNIFGLVNFIRDVGIRPENKTLDRINNNLGYSKANCKWSTSKEQQNNMEVNGYYYSDNSKCWVSTIVLNSSGYLIGNFNSEDSAKSAYEEIKKVKVKSGDNEAIKHAESLRIESPLGKQLSRNKTSSYYGVSWSNERQKWCALSSYRVSKGSPLINKPLGRYDCEIEAKEAVDNFLKWVYDNGYFKTIRRRKIGTVDS